MKVARKTLGQCLGASGPSLGPTAVSVEELLERDPRLSYLLVTDPSWSEEEIEAVIAERLRTIEAGRGLIVVPPTLSGEEWDARFNPPIEC